MNAIIVGVDGSDHSRRAVEWAAEEAVRRKRPLRIVHATAPWLYDTSVDPRLATMRTWLLSGGEEVLDEAVAAARARDGDLMVEGRLVPGGAAKALLEQARGASMLVVGSHGVGTVAGILLGSTALQVVSHTTVPTAIIRQFEAAERREIAVGVDGSAPGEAALAFAFEEAALREARLRAIHVWSRPGADGPVEMTPLVYDEQVVTSDQDHRLGEMLAAWRDKYPEVEVVGEVVHGRPVRVLAGASARADLLVVGTRGRGGFAGLVLGSVSHGLLHHAHAPLILVPSTG